MIVVGISASPRRSGNTEIMLNKALEGSSAAGASIEKIILNELDFKPCQECGGCDKTGRCVIRDDMDQLYDKLDKADACIIASPIYFTSVSAQAKMMIDRFQCSWISKYILKDSRPEKKRRGIFLSVAGSHNLEHFENAKRVIRAFFATIDIEYEGDLLRGGLDKMADISQDKKILSEAYDLGKDLVKNR